MARTSSLLKTHGHAVSVSVRILDIAVVALTGWLSYLLRFGFDANGPMRSEYVSCMLAGVVIAGVTLPLVGVYRSWRGIPLPQAVGRAVLGWAAAFLILLTILFAGHWTESYSRLWLGFWGLLSAFAIGAIRVAAYAVLSWIRRRGFNTRRVLLFGAGELGRRVLESAAQEEWAGFQVVLVLDDDPAKANTTLCGLPVDNRTSQVAELVAEHGIDEVWIALPLRAESRVHELLYALRHSVVNIRLMPDVFGLRLLNHSVTELAGVPAISLTETPLTGTNRIVKAAEDRVLAALILIVVSPLMLILAIGVKLSSAGPILYRQERVGWNGKPFNMLKFRSMPVDAEAAGGARWAKRGDDRATPFGAFIRRTSLDELPQFINVIKGDMSIVGPRPERPVFVERFKDEIPQYMQKHLVKAGITGWAQINGWRGDTDLRKRIEYDLFYIENWSLSFDLRIIAMTLFKGFFHQNAY